MGMKSRAAVLTLLAAATVVAAQTNSLADKRYGDWGVDLAARDLSIRPGDDFDYYAGGTWAKNAPIPPDSSFALRSFAASLCAQILSNRRRRRQLTRSRRNEGPMQAKMYKRTSVRMGNVTKPPPLSFSLRTRKSTLI